MLQMEPNKKKITVNEAISLYLKWKQSHTTKAYDAYRVRLELFAKYLENHKGVKWLREIDPDDIINFHNQMQETYSPATVAYSARILKNFFDFMRGRSHTNINPKEIIPIRFINADKAVVTLEDFEDMCLALDDQFIPDLQKKLAIHLLWKTGMRVSELLSLKLSDLQEKGENGLRTAKVKTKKTHRYNLVAWDQETDEILLSYLRWRLNVDHPTDLLFVSTYKKRASSKGLTSRTIERWVKDLCDTAMIDKHLTPHSFRHGKAHFLLDQGATAVDVQAVLRHRNLNSSINYMQLNQNEYLRTVGKFLKRTPVLKKEVQAKLEQPKIYPSLIKQVFA